MTLVGWDTNGDGVFSGLDDDYLAVSGFNRSYMAIGMDTHTAHFLTALPLLLHQTGLFHMEQHLKVVMEHI